MTIEVFIAPKTEAKTLIRDLLSQLFSVEEFTAERLYDFQILPLINKLKDNVYLLAETQYVDKVFRDSYYSYYSSKLFNYSRNCIRISLFECEVSDEDFRNSTGIEKLRNAYLGFFLLRPTDPAILGRNLITPRGLKSLGFACVLSRFQTTVNGLKFSVEGFPHSSQDSETITCAETTIWSVMEYFGHRYPEYRPVLPSKIIQTLNRVSSERQVPSKGLNIQQMSFALREFGFGTRIYSKQEYGSQFNSLLGAYVESGIPLVIAMEDWANGIGHALLCIGREIISDSKVDSLSTSAIPDGALSQFAQSKNIVFYDYAALTNVFLFIDDNHSSYQLAEIENPAKHYPAKWHNCKISFFIAPLYQKIYLEAYQAKNFFLQFLLKGPVPIKDGTESILRIYLSSSRTFKDQLVNNGSFNDSIKSIILETPMPKFIWICEMTNKDLLKQNQANGIIILDATEANIFFNKPLIIAAYQDNLVSMDNETKKLVNNVISLGTFTVFEGNLKSFN